MLKQIPLAKHLSFYTLRPSRSRRLTITVYPDGRVVVSAPKHSKPADVERFVAAKSAWIQSKLAHFAARAGKRDLVREKFLRSHGIDDVTADTLSDLLFRKTSKTERAKQYAAYKERARALVTERLLKWSAFYAKEGVTFTYKRIAIRNQKTRWGSCSKQKDGTANLNFNWKLAVLPQGMADYIIVHELCHLHELNHGPHFWKLVSRAMPDYMEIRRELRGVGVVLG